MYKKETKMRARLLKILKFALLSFLGVFILLVGLSIYLIANKDKWEAEDVKREAENVKREAEKVTERTLEVERRASDPVYKAKAEAKDEEERLRKQAKTDAEFREYITKKLADEDKALQAKQSFDRARYDLEKTEKDVYQRLVEKDAEKLLAAEKYIKDVQDAADKKR